MLQINQFDYQGGNLYVLTEAIYGGSGTGIYINFYNVTDATNMQAWNRAGGNYTVDAKRPNIKLTFVDATEPIQRLSLEFPAGVRVDSSSNITVTGAPARRLITNNAMGWGPTMIWENTSGQVNHGDTATGTIYAYVQEGFAGTMQVPYIIEGDGSGNPSHSVSGTLSLTNLGPILPTITVMTPNGGNRISIGTSYSILWAEAGTIPGVDILLSRDNGLNWETLASNTGNTGLYEWLVTGPSSNQCIVKIQATADYGIYDVSNSVFTVFQPVTWLTASPISGEISPELEASILVSVNSQNLDPGTFQAWLMVEHNAGEPISVPVTLVINDPTVNLSAPQNLVIIFQSSLAHLSWSPVPGAVLYDVYRAERPDGPFEFVDSSYDPNWSDEESIYVDRYFYQVRATSDLRQSAASAGPKNIEPIQINNK